MTLIISHAYQFLQEPLSFLRDLNIPVRIVGGAVRDALLNVRTLDIDVAVKMPPKELVEVLESSNVEFVMTGKSYGVCEVVWRDYRFEFAPLRTDISCDGRQANEVEFGVSYEEDAKRRDFTINALYMDIDGKIYDYFDGLKDLERGTINFIGKAEMRLKEDHLRFWRYIRFFARFSNRKIDDKNISTFKGLIANYSLPSLGRIQSELLGSMGCPKTLQAMQLLEKVGAWKKLGVEHVNFGAMERYHVVCRGGEISSEKTFKKTLSPFNPIFELATLGPFIVKIFPWAKSELKLLNLLFSLRSEINLNQAYLDFPNNFQDIIHFYMSWRGVSSKDYKAYMVKVDKFPDSPDLPIKSNDLIDLGITPGPKMGEVLKAVNIWWCENNFAPSHQACLDYINKILLK